MENTIAFPETTDVAAGPVPAVVPQRFAIVLHPKVEGGQVASVAATVAGGLRAAGFTQPIADADGTAHVGIQWSLVVLKAKTSSQLLNLLASARERSVQAVAFTRFGQELNNQFAQYTEQIERSRTEDLDVIAVGLYGPDTEVRGLTRPFSFLK